MVNLSDRKIIHTGDRNVDPHYRIPDEDVEGFGPGSAGVGGDPLELVDDESAGDGIGVPTDIRVETLTTRSLPDGTDVVDVIISYEPARSAAKHELRITEQ